MSGGDFLKAGLLLLWPMIAAAAPILSHPPARPLPAASQRPLADGRAYFVHPVSGDDSQVGTKERPWKTLAHAAVGLKPGDTLVLRGGTYYEHVALSVRGTAERPITIRVFPGELAILDGGLREFFEQPADAWEACPGGAAGEFQSKRTFAGLDIDAGDGPAVFGNFGDSLVPLQAYRFHGDLRSDNPYWNVQNKVGDESFVYCGPGVFYDRASGRIHCRLAHMKLPGLGEDNYRGETDPRKLPLVIAGGERPPLMLENCEHVRLHDLVLRGSRQATLQIHDCRNIELDGLAVYGGHAAIQVTQTQGLRMQHTACRGIGAPWTFRGMLKYRSVEARIFNASHWDPTGNDNANFEIRNCEFTDSVDGVFIGNVRGVRFHDNLVENVTDDGVFLTAGTGYDGATHGGDVHIYQNHFARILTTFAFGVGHGRQKMIPLPYGREARQTGSGVWIYRNVFDFRRPVWYTWPASAEAPQEITSRGRFASDHGGPAWEPMWIYHNTILAGGTPRYDYGCDGLIHGISPSTSRRVFNNIVCLTEGTPGTTLPPAGVDFQGDGNLFWSLKPDKPVPKEPFAKFRASPAFQQSKATYPPGWTANDRLADPQFVKLAADWHEQPDLRLSAGSPAIDAGVSIDPQWPDPLRKLDQGAPDLGAIPHGSAQWPGAPSAEWHFPYVASRDDAARPRAMIVEGYPAFDAPIVAYLLRKAGWQVDIAERQWFELAKAKDYRLIVYDGSLARAKVAKTKFDAADAEHMRSFLEGGGTLLVTRERFDVFGSPEGRKFLEELVGAGSREPQATIEVRQPEHPWLKSLAGQSAAELPWLARGTPLRTTRGESLIGSATGASLLHAAPLGRGRFIYLGWSPAADIPHGREKTTVADEIRFEQQVAIVAALLKQ